MTILEAIHQIDSQRHNTCTQAQKTAWLSSLDAMVAKLILEPCNGPAEFAGYDDATSPDTPLLVPAPFDEVYRYWLEARIDYQNGEYSRYNNSNAMFDAAWQRYADYRNRTAPAGGSSRFF